MSIEQDGALKVGVAGLGVAGGGILTTLIGVPGIEVVAGADPRENARALFHDQYHGRAYDSLGALCDDDEVEAVWISTPTHLHAEHVQIAAERGKHIVVEKPFAVTLEECDRMIESAEKNGVALIAGGARSFDPIYVAMREVIDSGRIGKVGALNSFCFTSFLLRARDAYELDVSIGGGTVYNQAPHPIDVLRLLGGGIVKSVRGATAEWMAERPCPGYFTAFLEFDNGVLATLSYNGYGYLDAAELVPWGETPQRQSATEVSYAYRRFLRSGQDEHEARERRRFGGSPQASAGPSGDGNWTPDDVGIVVASCERGDIRQSATGLYVYDDDGRHDEPLAPNTSMRSNEVDELRSAIRKEPALHDGRWGRATMEVVLALMESSAQHKEIELKQQVPAP